MTERGSVLVIAAHPDDEVLGCGATISRLSSDARVSILILGEGVTSRSERPDDADAAQIEALRRNAREAAEIMGAVAVEFGGLPDNRFDERPLLSVVKLVEAVIARIAPRTIFTHHSADLNIDHQITFRSVLTATRPVAGQPVREVYSFEIASSTEWAFARFEPAFRPNYFVDVGPTIERKFDALRRYGSELRPFPHPRSEEALRAIARRWGSVAGVEYAEAFELIRAIH